MTDAPIVIERRYRATPAQIWRLWTTSAGLESWWGPQGFAVTVQELDLRPGGALRYTMTAVDPQMVAFMNRNAMPTATVAQVLFDEVTPMTRLRYRHLVDFVPGQSPYHTRMQVDLVPQGDAVLLRLPFDALHVAVWTERQRMGWEQELGKLQVLLTAQVW